MKKCIFLIILIVVYGVCIVLFGIIRDNYKSDSKILHKTLEKGNLVDIDGNINFTQLESKRKELENGLDMIFKGNNFELVDYNKKLEEIEKVNDEVNDKYDNLLSELNDLEKEKEVLENQYQVLENKYNNELLVDLNSDINFKDILINQYPKYASGCESVALTMLLNYYGIDVSVDEIIEKLNKEKLPYYENGIKYGGNPEVGFVGNPYLGSSYGVYEKPIADVANGYKEDIKVKNDFSFNEVLNIVSSGRPVMVWTSMGLSIPYISESWVYMPTGEEIFWKANEHALIIVSYDDNKDTILVADPMGGNLKTYSVSLFEQRYNYFGRKAVYYL